MIEIAGYIEDGTRAFVRRQYRTIAIIVALLIVPLALFFRNVTMVVSFLFGAFFSLLAAYIGLRIAVKTNVRTTHAATISSAEAFS